MKLGTLFSIAFTHDTYDTIILVQGTMRHITRLSNNIIFLQTWVGLKHNDSECFQGDADGAGKVKEEDDVGDLDDILKREREIEKRSKESASADVEVAILT